MGVQQAILWDATCAKVSLTPTVDAATGWVTYSTSGLKPGVYYISVKIDPTALVGRSVSSPYPSVPYVFGTYLSGNLYQSSAQTITVTPKV